MNRYSIITLYLKRSQNFGERVASLLRRVDLERGYSQEIVDFEEGLFQAGVEGENVYDAVMDFSSDLADEYMLLSDGIYSAVLTSIYHLWEHDIKDLCKHKLRYSAVAEGDELVTDQKIQYYKYEKLKSLLLFWGAQESTFDQVNLLRLVANTIKHGAGPSASELLNNNKKYYRKLALFRDLDLDGARDDFAESEVLGVEDIEYFRAALATFWVELDKSISA
jgi:hypothetical protein